MGSKNCIQKVTSSRNITTGTGVAPTGHYDSPPITLSITGLDNLLDSIPSMAFGNIYNWDPVYNKKIITLCNTCFPLYQG